MFISNYYLTISKFYAMKILATFLFCALIGSTSGYATNYYISSGGNDANSGQSPSVAWQTLAKVTATTFQPGDSILFEAGDIWNGTFSPHGSGTAGSPIVVDKYGIGNNPAIYGLGVDQSATFSLTNQSYWEINNLEITNAQLPGGTSRLWGILVKCTSDAAPVTHIYVQKCHVHRVGSLTDESNANFNKGTGGMIFNGLINEALVKGCHIDSVSVAGVRNSSTTYNSAITRNIGRNLCYNTSSANYAGMWTYGSSGTTVAYNEVSGITGGGVNDGQPFDADISTSGDIFEYNYTHDNRRGFMLFMPSATNIIVRFNISVNDAQDGVRIFNYTNTSGNTGNKIYNNVFYIPNNINQIFQGGFSGIWSNNIIYCTGTVSKFSQASVNTTSSFFNNCFYPQSIITSNGPAGNVSGNVYADPMFVNAGFNGAGITGGVQNAYSLLTNSPCINTGLNIPNNGGLDFARTNILNGTYSSMGAIWPTPTSFTTTTTTSTVVLTTGDAYTYDKNPTSNYGTAPNLVAKFGGGYAQEGTTTAIGYSRRTYLMFPSYAIDTATMISKVYVRMRYYARDVIYATNGIKISLSRIPTWNENTITWNSQTTDGGALDSLGYSLNDGNPLPPAAPNPITDAFINSYSYYVYLDVTDTILAMKAHSILPTNLSFVLQGIATATGASIGNTGFTFFSKEFTNTSGNTVDSLGPSLLIYASTTSVLPVEASLLTAQVVNHSVQLKWTTYTESNTDLFIIERSSDGSNFTTLSTVKAKSNSQKSISYAFEDMQPLAGLNYYRWREMDLDGKVAGVSNIVRVNFLGNPTYIIAYPNPLKAGALLTMHFDNNVNASDVNIRFTDAGGRIVCSVVKQINQGAQNIGVSTEGVARGIYLVTLTGKGIRENTKIIIE